METAHTKSNKIFDFTENPVMRLTPFDIHGKMWGFILIIIAAVLVLLVSGYNWSMPSYTDPEKPHSPHGSVEFSNTPSAKDVYGIMFDAGSTGSRIHIFHFLSYGKGKQMKLVRDIFREIKPGLSAYAENTHQAGLSLLDMLEQAKRAVPTQHHALCPIALKATAGLRLLGMEKSQNILNQVRDTFMQYPFKMVDNNIEIMSGSDEGIFSWITVNYMLELLSKPEQSVAALDLGGGSTQITFVPFNSETLQSVGSDFSKEITLVGKTYRLYTHSYLGLGLMSARFSVMQKVDGNPTQLVTPCFGPKVREILTHKGTKYVASASPGENGYMKCYMSVRDLVTKNIKVVKELNDHSLMAFSYFYDRAIDSNLIGVDGGNVTVRNFLSAAEIACQSQDSSKPYLCLDLTYIFSLLTDGYNLSKGKVLLLSKKVKGVEISWAIGAVFDLFSQANVS